MLEHAQRWATPAALAAVVVVCVAAAAESLGLHALPDGDSAYVAMRIRDVTTSHPPLVGMPTTLAMTVQQASHLGPLPFVAVGLLDRLFFRASWSLVVASAIVNALALASAVLAARKAWGPWASVAAAAAGCWLVWSIGNEITTDVINTSTPIAACFAGALAFVAAVDGRPRLLPLAVVWMSYAAQGHLSFGPLGLAVAGAAVVLACLPPVALDRRWRVATVGVAAVCWLPVVVQQLTGHPGNLSALARATSAASDGPTAGGGFARALGGHVLGLPAPFGVRPYEQPIFVHGQSVGSALLLLVPIAVAITAVTLAAREHRRAAPVVAAVAIATVAVLTCSRATVAFGGVPQQYVRVLWPAGLCLWLTLAVSLARSPALPRRAAAAAWPVAAVGLVVVAGAAAVARRDFSEAEIVARSTVARPAADALADRPEVDDGATLVLTTDGFAATNNLGPMLVAELQRRGVRARVLDAPGLPVRSYRELRVVPSLGEGDLPVYVGPAAGAPDDAEVVAAYPRLTPAEREELADIDARLVAALDGGDGADLDELGEVILDGPIGDRGPELVADRRYSTLLTAGLVRNSPLDARGLARYQELLRLEDPRFDLVVAVGG